ncbi:MAG: hypothetical protein C4584_00340 [Armatimonadetes bacterium]|nr:MAG: hypothetical protein C4584_00340 [Armatimonadota bacterium]
MYYLSRNKEVIAEAKRFFIPKKGIRVGDTSSAGVAFTLLGSFPSLVLGREVFIGLKEYTESGDNTWRLKLRATLELSTITIIAEHIEQMREDLPAFYALLKDVKGIPIGILMEDFSEGGKVHISGTCSIPSEVTSLFGEDVLESDYTCNAGFYVGNRIKYGDFYPFFQTYQMEKALARHPMNQVMRLVTRNMWKHTFRLGKDL